MTIADEKMLIKTKFGTLVAYASDDDERPGIFIDLRRPGFGVDAPLLAIECDESGDEPVLRSAIWENVNEEDHSRLVEHTGISKFFTLWKPGGIDEEYPVEGLL